MMLGLFGQAGLGDATKGIENALFNNTRIALQQAFAAHLAIIARRGVIVQDPAEVDDRTRVIADRSNT